MDSIRRYIKIVDLYESKSRIVDYVVLSQDQNHFLQRIISHNPITVQVKQSYAPFGVHKFILEPDFSIINDYGDYPTLNILYKIKRNEDADLLATNPAGFENSMQIKNSLEVLAKNNKYITKRLSEFKLSQAAITDFINHKTGRYVFFRDFDSGFLIKILSKSKIALKEVRSAIKYKQAIDDFGDLDE